MADEGHRPAPRPCPVCGKPATAALRPFCSERCRQVDLGRWLAGDYAIPGDPAPDSGEPPDKG
jgi:uncharacterized protein